MHPNIDRVSEDTVKQHTLEYLQAEFPLLNLESDRLEEIYTVGFIENLVANAMYPPDGLPYRAIDAPTGIKWGNELSRELGERRFRLYLAGIARHLRRDAKMPEWPKKVIEDLESFADSLDVDVLTAAHKEAEAEHEESLGGRFTIRPADLSLVFALHPEIPGMALAHFVNFIKQRDTQFAGLGKFQVTSQIEAIRSVAALKDDLVAPIDVTQSFSSEKVPPDAVALANHMYESRDFSLMGQLADHLEQAGLDAKVVEHCRDETIYHMRGCWVIDALRAAARN